MVIDSQIGIALSIGVSSFVSVGCKLLLLMKPLSPDFENDARWKSR